MVYIEDLRYDTDVFNFTNNNKLLPPLLTNTLEKSYMCNESNIMALRTNGGMISYNSFQHNP